MILEEAESALELEGIGPRVIGIFMILITLAPLGTILIGPQDRLIYSIFWIILVHSSKVLFDPSLLALLWIICPLYIFSILYIRQIVRFYYGKSSRDSALMCGLLSAIFPSLVGLGVSILLGFSYSEYLYIIPVPIQFVVGLYFIYRFREPEVVSPWSGQFIDWSWWKRLGAKWSNWIIDRIDIHFQEEEIVMSMSLDEVEVYFSEKCEGEAVACKKCGKETKLVFICEYCGSCIDCCQCHLDEDDAE
jgi:hypothetical protein